MKLGPCVLWLVVVLAPPLARAVSLVQYALAGCRGDANVTYAANDACVNPGSGSYRISCERRSRNSEWTYQAFAEPDCPGAAGFPEVTGTGRVCSNDQVIDCGAPSSPPGSSHCFSGAALVQRHDGRAVPLSELRVGDRVLSVGADGRAFFDRVFRVTHWEPEARAELVRLRLAGGWQLELTHGHLVLAGTLELGPLRPARQVRAGDVLFVVAGGGERAEPAEVTAVERAEGRGLFNVHTVSGRLVVDGVAATHLTEESSWGSLNWAAPLWYRLRDALSPALGAEDARIRPFDS